MPTIRSRVLEITSSSEAWEAPVEHHEIPGVAKLEADARVAICVDEITHQLQESDVHRQRFLGHFSQSIIDEYPSAQNTDVYPQRAVEIFQASFAEAYFDEPLITDVLETTDKGQKAVQACGYFIDACVPYLEGASSLRLPIWLDSYAEPSTLVQVGMDTFKEEIGPILRTVNHYEIPPEIIETCLQKSGVSLTRRAGLALRQSQAAGSREIPIMCREGYIDALPNLREIQQLPKYHSAQDELLRPHTGCLALPVLPANEFLHGGSTIKTFWGLTVGLALATNVHALFDDDPELSVVDCALQHLEATTEYLNI